MPADLALRPGLLDLERRRERRQGAVAHVDIERGLVLHPRMLGGGPVLKSADVSMKRIDRVSPGLSVTRWNPLSSLTGLAELP